MSIYEYSFRIPQKYNPYYYEHVVAESSEEAWIKIKEKYPNQYIEICPNRKTISVSEKSSNDNYSPEERCESNKRWNKYLEDQVGKALDRSHPYYRMMEIY